MEGNKIKILYRKSEGLGLRLTFVLKINSKLYINYVACYVFPLSILYCMSTNQKGIHIVCYRNYINYYIPCSTTHLMQ
jgi:hypothetical protein